MRRDVLLFVGTTAFAAVLAFVFWNQLRESSKRTAEMQQQADLLASTRDPSPGHPVSNNEVQQPAVASAAGEAPPVAQVVAGDANSPGAALPPGCEATLARAKQNAAARMSEWALELQLAPDQAQKMSEIRQAQTVARSSCASSGGSNANLEQLHDLFLAALGPAHLEQLVDLNANRQTQVNISFWDKQFKTKGTPLNDEQARLLRTVLLEENRQLQRETAITYLPNESRAVLADQEKQLKLAEERWERIQAAAQSFLSPEQLAQFRDSATLETDRKRSTLKSMREAVERGENINYQPPLLSIYNPPPSF